ncbi:hypothetical protein BDZ89DRAFT_1032950 [Hymenopellis radicata]|nr:hypothetical protein BDZ89DRAFT_1032950 [Hymenopellis radicata]
MRSFYFQQDKHYKSGFVLDDDNHVVYKLYDEDDDHFWSNTFKDRPLGSIKFSRGHKTAFNDQVGLFGRKGKRLTGWGNILDSDMAFVLPGGRKYEWCTEDYEVFTLVDWCGVKRDMWESRVHETLPEVAELRIRKYEYTQLDFKVRDIRLLEACIVTSLVLEDLLKGHAVE